MTEEQQQPNAEESLARAEALLARLEQTRAELERIVDSENPDDAIGVLTELAEIAKQVEAELSRARSSAERESE